MSLKRVVRLVNARGIEALKQAEAWASLSINTSDSQTGREALRAVSLSFLTEPRSLGRVPSGEVFEASVRNKAKGATTTELDAPVGVSAEEGQLHLPSSQEGGGQAVSTRVIKTQ